MSKVSSSCSALITIHNSVAETNFDHYLTSREAFTVFKSIMDFNQSTKKLALVIILTSLQRPSQIAISCILYMLSTFGFAFAWEVEGDCARDITSTDQISISCILYMLNTFGFTFAWEMEGDCARNITATDQSRSSTKLIMEIPYLAAQISASWMNTIMIKEKAYVSTMQQAL